MKILNSVFAIAALTLVSSIASATVWIPTNEDTDFIQIGPIYDTNGADLAMFDDSDFGGTALTIGDAGGQVVFTDNMDGSWNAEFFDVNDISGGSITLSGDNSFVLGMTWDGGSTYYTDSSYALVSAPDDYRIAFTDGEITGRTLAIDVAPIPVPAAVWLFGTGLLGLVGVARRRA